MSVKRERKRTGGNGVGHDGRNEAKGFTAGYDGSPFCVVIVELWGPWSMCGLCLKVEIGDGKMVSPMLALRHRLAVEALGGLFLFL